MTIFFHPFAKDHFFLLFTSQCMYCEGASNWWKLGHMPESLLQGSTGVLSFLFYLKEGTHNTVYITKM